MHRQKQSPIYYMCNVEPEKELIPPFLITGVMKEAGLRSRKGKKHVPRIETREIARGSKNPREGKKPQPHIAGSHIPWHRKGQKKIVGMKGKRPPQGQAARRGKYGHKAQLGANGQQKTVDKKFATLGNFRKQKKKKRTAINATIHPKATATTRRQPITPAGRFHPNTATREQYPRAGRGGLARRKGGPTPNSQGRFRAISRGDTKSRNESKKGRSHQIDSTTRRSQGGT